MNKFWWAHLSWWYDDFDGFGLTEQQAKKIVIQSWVENMKAKGHSLSEIDVGEIDEGSWAIQEIDLTKVIVGFHNYEWKIEDVI